MMKVVWQGRLANGGGIPDHLPTPPPPRPGYQHQPAYSRSLDGTPPPPPSHKYGFGWARDHVLPSFVGLLILWSTQGHACTMKGGACGVRHHGPWPPITKTNPMACTPKYSAATGSIKRCGSASAPHSLSSYTGSVQALSRVNPCHCHLLDMGRACARGFWFGLVWFGMPGRRGCQSGALCTLPLRRVLPAT